MHWSTHVLSFCALGTAVLPVAAFPATKGNIAARNGKPTYVTHPNRVTAVKAAFQRSWDGYTKYAFPHDSLRPISNSYQDDRNGWGASAVDALSTALVLENADAVNTILKHVASVDFDKADGDISLFETTIRYLGGLLSGYDLLKGPQQHLAPSNTTLVDTLLVQAKHLADNLKVAFDTASGVPDNSVFFDPPRRNGSQTNGLATTGSLIMEWTRLADLTNTPLYGELAQKAESYLLDPQPQNLAEPFPGLLGTNIDIKTGHFLDGSGGWVGGDDSFYEYLLKMYLYDPVRFSKYKDQWVKAVDSSIKYLASHPSSQPDLTFLAMYSGTTPIFYSQHLACFDAGNIILGGLTLKSQSYIDFGLNLTASCHDTYTSTATRIGPESFRWQDDGHLAATTASNNPPPPANVSAFYEKAGFWIDNQSYDLRPEVIESYYYAYRATGDTKYQDWAWDAFKAINATCSQGSGYTAVGDVNTVGGGQPLDSQESFWFAEVLKYSYLIQADDALFQVQPDNTNQFVFNTECHPVKIPGGESSAVHGYY